ncbi:MAG: hypothetical protein JRI79_02935 [Deltaproteobacteria bacterium]|nr:hypothetical protein [Deltaproteobacteria bacterium]MBW1921327.1 hypothetical protein [Deltaproteobacteria bacterium]MBW1934454.1 hypothetical protein [Deltaproteobacteria bacterium]MBW1976917.1 hypothetical protein [Deltaproteobacteria bacterium]MBW2043572.1 hypothetical protein [Deltaproteobacteria bacterium]
MWIYRERLSYFEKLRRSLYEILRDALEIRLMKISLIDSFYKFLENGVEYVFLEKSELKPGSKKMEKESELYNTFIVIFCEGTISPELKNYIRFFPENKVVKKNLQYLAELPLHKNFSHNLRYFDKPDFLDFLESLLNVDYALLIQQDPSVKRRNRYALTHMHVKIDWPIADAAEDLAKWLRYVQNSIYERGDEEARILQNKLFEYYGCHHSVGGRRTAGLIAAQLLRKQDFISTVYVSSSESRTLVKYSERGVSKFFLIKLTDQQIRDLAKRESMNTDDLKSGYLYTAGSNHVGIAEAVYTHTPFSTPPTDGKLRRCNPAYNWLKLRDEFLHPKDAARHARPLSYSWVYTPE